MLVTLYKTFACAARMGQSVYVKAENERFTAHATDSCCCENFKCENFTSSFGRIWKQIASKSVPHVQRDYISAFNQSNH